jgi:hypothetical protein
MQKFTSFKACIIASCLLSSAVPAEAMASKNTSETIEMIVSELKNHPFKSSMIAFLSASLFMFLSRKPDNNPSRCTLENLLENPTLENLNYYFRDEILGQQEQSSTPKIDKETGNWVIKEGFPAKGYVGHLSTLVKPLTITALFVLTCQKALNDEKGGGGILPGIAAWLALSHL